MCGNQVEGGFFVLQFFYSKISPETVCTICLQPLCSLVVDFGWLFWSAGLPIDVLPPGHLGRDGAPLGLGLHRTALNSGVVPALPRNATGRILHGGGGGSDARRNKTHFTVNCALRTYESFDRKLHASHCLLCSPPPYLMPASSTFLEGAGKPFRALQSWPIPLWFDSPDHHPLTISPPGGFLCCLVPHPQPTSGLMLGDVVSAQRTQTHLFGTLFPRIFRISADSHFYRNRLHFFLWLWNSPPETYAG